MQSIPEFNAAQVASLKAFLDAPGRSPDSMGYCEAAGFLFVVASAPELIQPAQWMPIIIDPDNAEEKSLESMKTITSGLISLYNEMTRQVQDADLALPPDCSFRDDLMANLEVDAPVSQWSRGFTAGYNWLDEMWSQYTPQELKEEFGYQCSVLSFFCSPAMANAYVNEVKNKDVTIESLGEDMRRLFPDAMRGVALLGFSIQQALLQRDSAEQQPVVRGDKVGRNDPCTCGSGKKYKKCCGGVLH